MLPLAIGFVTNNTREFEVGRGVTASQFNVTQLLANLRVPLDRSSMKTIMETDLVKGGASEILSKILLT